MFLTSNKVCRINTLKTQISGYIILFRNNLDNITNKLENAFFLSADLLSRFNLNNNPIRSFFVSVLFYLFSVLFSR